MMLKGNIIILVVTPMAASTASEMSPAMLFSRIPANTPRPERNMEEAPTLTISPMMSLQKWKFRMDSRSRLRRVR